MHEKTIAQLSAGLAAGEFSSEELTRAFLERIERFNPQLNAFITVTAEAALAQARAADQRRRQGKPGR
jgi:aspartyl-tRNA(Asn)/glutamyl-tRNA(Gln) amidotransferase subunit A